MRVTDLDLLNEKVVPVPADQKTKEAFGSECAGGMVDAFKLARIVEVADGCGLPPEVQAEARRLFTDAVLDLGKAGEAYDAQVATIMEKHISRKESKIIVP